MCARQPSLRFSTAEARIETAVRFGVYTGDPRVIALKDHVVTELLKAQSPDGYIGCLCKKARLWGYWDLAETGFIILGLSADHHYFGEKRSLAVSALSENNKNIGQIF